MNEKEANKVLNYFITQATIAPGMSYIVKSNFHNTTGLRVKIFYKRMSIQPTCSEKEKKCSRNTKLKNLLILLLLFTSFSHVFSQNKYKSESLNKNKNLKNFDSLVDIYETRGTEFYSHAKYDSAIRKYIKAKSLIDSLSSKRKEIGDYINSLVTSCNIAASYCKLQKFGLGLREISEIDNKKWWELSNNDNIAFQTSNKMLAFIQFTEGDCYKKMNAKKALQYYFSSYCNLVNTHYGDSIVTYKYALKAYTYKVPYRETLKAYVNARDSDNVDVNLYLNSLSEISKDK